MKRGFTLVELSIVLVIIGLLIGGILVAQSMIDTARVSSTVSKLSQFDTAIANFQTKYNSLPGDYAGLGCVQVNRNVCGNGIIEDSFSSNPTDLFDGEIANFWPQLQAGGYFKSDGILTPVVTNAFTTKAPNPNSPSVPLGNNTGIVPFNFQVGFKTFNLLVLHPCVQLVNWRYAFQCRFLIGDDFLRCF